MNKLLISALLALLVMLCGSVQAQDQGQGPAVMKVTIFDYDGAEVDMERRFRARAKLFRELNPEAAMILLRDEIAGEKTGDFRVHTYYPSLGYFAQAQGRLATSDEWQAMQAARGRATAGGGGTYESLTRVVVPSLRNAPPETPVEGEVDPPGVVHVILFTHAGEEADLIDNFKARQAIQAKINPQARLSLLKDEIAGGAIDRYRIHAFYPSVGYFAASQGRERTSEEWQKSQANRAGRSSSRVYEGLSRVVVGPPARRGGG